MADHDGLDLASAAGTGQPRLSRRRFLGYAGMGAAGLGLSGLLAACGGTGSSSVVGVDERRPGRRRLRLGLADDHRCFTFGNWPLYIDRDQVDGEQVHPSLELLHSRRPGSTSTTRR